MNLPITLDDFSLKEKALLGVLGMSLVWVAFDNSLYRPVAREMGTVKAKITELNGQVELGKKWSEKITPTRRRVQPELEVLKRPYLIEINKQVAECNRIIDTALDRQNIQVKSMNPGNVQPIQGKQYQMITFNQELNCGYNQLGAYLSDLENAELLIEVADIQITPLSDDSKRHKINLQLNAYLFNFE
jgi:Tfp pilus assembly protein PilO